MDPLTSTATRQPATSVNEIRAGASSSSAEAALFSRDSGEARSTPKAFTNCSRFTPVATVTHAASPNHDRSPCSQP